MLKVWCSRMLWISLALFKILLTDGTPQLEHAGRGWPQTLPEHFVASMAFMTYKKNGQRPFERRGHPSVFEDLLAGRQDWQRDAQAFL